MKMLEIENAHAYLKTAEGATPKMIKDINEDDVLDLVRTIMNGVDIEIDPDPSQDLCPNDAERIIYREIARQVRGLLKKREAILEKIDAEFDSAEKLYGKTEPVSDFEDWAIDVGDAK